MSKITYNKTPKTFNEQVNLLKERGLLFKNESRAANILQFISYNRLSNYWYPMLKDPKEEELFKPNSQFEDVFKIYQFDSQLRKITFHAIEQIEIGIRTQLIYHQSHKYTTGFWYEEFSAFKHYPNFINMLGKMSKNVQDSKQEFIKKYNKRYIQFLPPAWKSFELLTFHGLLSILKNLSEPKDLIPICSSFGLHHEVFLSWIDTIIYIRNVCAHHSRLWNIKLTISPTWPKSTYSPWVSRWENEPKNDNTNDKVLKTYAALCLIQYCLNHVNPYNTFGDELKKLIYSFPVVDIGHMGFTEQWEHEDLWKEK